MHIIKTSMDRYHSSFHISTYGWHCHIILEYHSHLQSTLYSLSFFDLQLLTSLIFHLYFQKYKFSEQMITSRQSQRPMHTHALEHQWYSGNFPLLLYIEMQRHKWSPCWQGVRNCNYTVVSYSITSLGLPRLRYWIRGVTGDVFSRTKMVFLNRRSIKCASQAG